MWSIVIIISGVSGSLFEHLNNILNKNKLPQNAAVNTYSYIKAHSNYINIIIYVER